MRLKFSDIHHFANRPEEHLDIVKNIIELDNGALDITFIDGMKLEYDFPIEEMCRILSKYWE